MQGPVALLDTASARTASLASPLALPVWVTDDGKYTSGTMAPPRKPPPPVKLTWSKYRGPGEVTFESCDSASADARRRRRERRRSAARPRRRPDSAQPGDYVLHLTVNDFSGDGGGGEVCCWTTAMVKVTVTN